MSCRDKFRGKGRKNNRKRKIVEFCCKNIQFVQNDPLTEKRKNGTILPYSGYDFSVFCSLGGEEMFRINDVVVYGTQGVCQIAGIDEQKTDGVAKTYFILKPKNEKGTTFYVPIWNEKALAKMRKVMTKDEVNALIDSMPGQKPAWIENENERKAEYKKILAGGDHAAILSMIQALYLYRKEREAEGKRLHMSDEYFMRDAEKLLHNEWQYVLNVDKDGLMAYILERIENNR